MGDERKQPFAGLPPALVGDLVEKSGRLTGEIHEYVRNIRSNLDTYRSRLLDNGLIKTVRDMPDSQTPTACGIDGVFGSAPALQADLAFAAAFAVEGIPPRAGEKHWDTPVYKTAFYAERNRFGSNGLLRAIAYQMQAVIAAEAPHGVVILNGSFITALTVMMESLPAALRSKEMETGREFISRIKPAVRAFESIVNPDDRIRVGMPPDDRHRELLDAIQVSEKYDQSLFTALLLSPGEYAGPVPVAQGELSGVKALSIRDETFAAVRDGLVASLSGSRVLFYKPHEWTPVLRLEVPESVAGDNTRLAALFSCLNHQCATPGIPKPYPVYCAEKTARILKRAFPTIRRSVTGRLAGLLNDTIGDILSLLIDNDQNMGDYDE